MKISLPPVKQVAKTFPYESYAELMTQVSVGGINPGELCPVKFYNFGISQNILDIFDTLLKKGYKVNLIVKPEEVEKIVQTNRTRKYKNNYKSLNGLLGKEYSHVVWMRDIGVSKSPSLNKWFDFAGNSKKLESLLRRNAKAGESIQLHVVTSDSDRLVEEIVKRIVKNQGIPYIMGSNAQLRHHACINAVNDEQLSFVNPDTLMLFQTMQKFFSIHNDSDETFARIEIPPVSVGDAEYERRKTLFIKAASKANSPFMERMSRVEWGALPPGKFFRTLALSPSVDLASEMGFTADETGLDDFGEFYKKITHLDKADPVDFYKRMMLLVDHYTQQLRKFHTIKLEREDKKTNVTLSIRESGAKESRYVCPSTITGNALPAEIFTSPVEDSVEGKIYFDLPFVLDNKEFNGLTLAFKGGQVVDLDLEHGDKEHLQGRILGKGPKSDLKIENFDRLGEFAIGFNRMITNLLNGRAVHNTLIAEKQDVHFALGDGYTITGGKNKCDLHVDISLKSSSDSGLTISGLHDNSSDPVVIRRDGEFTEDFLNLGSTFDWKQYSDIKWD